MRSLIMERAIYQLKDACELMGVAEDLMREFVAKEWLRPAETGKLAFDDEDLARFRLIWQLQEDFGVNDEGVDIILHLIDELNFLRRAVVGSHS